MMGRWEWYVPSMGKKSNAYMTLVGSPEGNIPIRRLICRWVDNIEMDLRRKG
jgi:hypothetical protein